MKKSAFLKKLARILHYAEQDGVDVKREVPAWVLRAVERYEEAQRARARAWEERHGPGIAYGRRLCERILERFYREGKPYVIETLPEDTMYTPQQIRESARSFLRSRTVPYKFAKYRATVKVMGPRRIRVGLVEKDY